jgi:hypothetical protein
MRSALAVATLLALLSGGAMAQSPPAQPPMDDHGAAEPAPPSQSDRDDGGYRGEMRPHRPPPPSKAARFRIEAGDISISMRCPEDESLRNCADFTLQMLDKLSNLPSHR